MPNRSFAVRLSALPLAAALLSTLAAAQSPVKPRISGVISGASRVTLTDTRSALALPANDIGVLPGDTPLSGITVVFNRSAAQQADLETLLAAQQDPASPLFHQWLTPAQFGARFGVADADLAATQSWLQSQGFTVSSVSPSRDRITVSGSAAQVASAFGTSLHYYREAADASRPSANAEVHYAPASDISLPAALAPVVLSVGNLSSFRVKPHLRAQPAFTSGVSGSHFLQPGDIAAIYDVNAAYNSGYTGSGVSIAVVGQSLVTASDVTSFQTSANVPVRAPSLIIVPNSGAATHYSGDESESDLDLEYTSAIAKGANVYFVYTGNNTNYGVFDSLSYAVQQNLAPIISVSYGACEAALGSSNINILEAVTSQAAAQGQTIIAAAGDDGSTDCARSTNLGAGVRYGLAVDYPAVSPYVTGLGGTEFTAAATAATNSTYFTAANGTDVVTSAKGYIPEQVWNDDVSTSTSFSAGGGGASIYINRPSWQAGTYGGVAFPSGSTRLVPDISLDSANGRAPYIFCTSDTSAWNTAANGGSAPYQQASCNSGFRDSSSQDLTLAGGTSFAAPIFAGMVALIVQAKGGAGLGLLNPTLYALAANPATYASAFHDITTGSNACLASASVCTGTGVTTSFAAVTGYDQATGLGSIDLKNLLTAYMAATTTTKSASKVTLSAAATTPSPGVADNITLSVSSNGAGTAVPTGTITVTVDGSTNATTLNLTNGVAVYSFSSAISGQHTITAVYAGDANYTSSSSNLLLTVGGNFTLSANPSTITVKAGSSGTSSITVTPTGGYTGTVTFTASAPSNLTNACYAISKATVTGSAAVSTTLTLYTSSGTCTGVVATGVQAYSFTGAGGHAALWTPPTPSIPTPNRTPAYAALGVSAALLALLRRRKSAARLAVTALSLGLLLAFGLGLTGCSDKTQVASTTTTSTNTPAGSYAVTLTGTDSVNGALSASTTVTLTVN